MNMTLHKTKVSINNAAIATVLSLPKSAIPIIIQRIINAPITRHQTQLPIENIPFAASAPS